MADVAVPTAAPLSAVRRVELIHTGSWAISSGSWNASRDDLVAAVAALDCPAVRQPVLKLGHSQGEQPLWAGNPTGAPAVGWVDNLALTNQGHTLVGDFVGMPGWLGDVAASAYPDRSVEGTYEQRCQIGHTHPFVVTAVALLGVTPPGVGTLRSLQDVGALYGVRADSGTRVVAQISAEPDASEPADSHLDGLTLGDSEVDVDLWSDGTVTLGWDNYQTTLDLAASERLVGGVNEIRGGQPTAEVTTGDGILRLAARPGGDVELAAGTATVLLSDDDAFDLQVALIDWLGDDTGQPEEVEARRFDPAKHPRWPKGTPGGLGGRFMPRDLVPRSTGTPSRSRRRTSPPTRRRVRTGVARSDARQTERALNVLIDEAGEVPGTRDRRGTTPALVDTLRRIRGDVGDGNIGPDEALQQVSQLILRTDIASNPHLGDAVNRAAGRIRDGEDQTPITPLAPTPDLPEAPTPDRPSGGLGQRVLDAAGRVRANPGQTWRDYSARGLAGDDWVFLADLRAELSGVPPEQLDDLLRRQARGRGAGVLLFQVTHPRFLRQRDYDARIQIGGEGVDVVRVVRPEALADASTGTAPSTPPAPSAPEPGRTPAGLPDGVVADLRAAGSTGQAQAMLAGLTAAQLRTVADEVGAAYGSGWRKQQIVDSIVQVTVGFRERGDAIMRGGGGPVGAAVQVAAAADVHTGAMVALLPSEEDRQRLAAVGGESADQLHVTLLFLGEAVAYSEAVREQLVAELREVAGVIPPGNADGFAVAAFNPNSDRRDTAIVLELGGDGLEDVHGIVTAAVEEVAAQAGLMLPEQHTPWRPHATLVYTDDLTRVGELADRTGPIRFDRIRVAFAGENTDIPLNGEPADDPNLDNLTDDEMPMVDGEDQVVAQESRRATRSDRPLRRYWLRGAGAAKIRWNTPGDWTRCVRQLRRHVRDPKGLCAVYHQSATGVWPGDRRNVGRRTASVPPQEAIMPNPNPTIIHAAAAVSVDDVRTAYYRQAPQQAWIREFHTEPKRLIVANDADGSVARVDFDVDDDGSIQFGQPVPVRVEYVERDDDDKVSASRMVYASRAESRPTVVTTPPPPPPGFEPAYPRGDVQAATVSSRPWSDFTEADYTPEQWRRATLLDRGEAAGDVDTKARYGLPVREPDGTLNRNGVHAAAGGHGIGAVKGISDELRRSTARKIVRLYRDELGEDPPDSLLAFAGQLMSAAADQPTTDPRKTPAAEPGTNPSIEEDDMPLSTEVYQRLGLAEDADESTVNAAVLALADRADTAPDPRQVAAAAAEKDDLTKEVGLLKGQVEAMSAKLAETEAEKAATVKASVLDTAAKEGKFAPAERDKWEADYDAAPAVVTRVLASIAPGTAVPTSVLGGVGNPADLSDDNLPPEPEYLFGPATEPAMAGKE